MLQVLLDIPDLDILREAGIPTVSDGEFAEALAEHGDQDHRRELRVLLDNSEWSRPTDADERSDGVKREPAIAPSVAPGSAADCRYETPFGRR